MPYGFSLWQRSDDPIEKLENHFSILILIFLIKCLNRRQQQQQGFHHFPQLPFVFTWKAELFSRRRPQNFPLFTGK
jgi:hypothetical protein